jgi:aryl-alcohol dehydrogenase-like predicted oxidoreductase
MGSAYSINLTRAALDAGVNYLHTSSGYSERNHERLLGEALKNVPRDSYVIASCPDLPYSSERRNGRSLDLGTKVDPRLIAESLEGSLTRLGLEYIDIYYLASVGSVEVTQHEPYTNAFMKLKSEGKARFAGVITHANEPAVIRGATRSGVWDVVLTAYNFRQSHRKEVGEAIHEAARAGLGVVAMKTQAGVYWSRPLGKRINMKAALKWVLQNEDVHTTIPAFSNFDEMREDLSVMRDLGLSPDELRDLELGDDLGYSGCYCQGCGRCLAGCPAGADVPTLMRAHMYAFSYEDPGKAIETVRKFDLQEPPCGSCSLCTVDCALGLDVRSRGLELGRLLSEHAG